MAMNPEVKAKWVEALRSEKYKQGRGRFYVEYDDAHCCLGVLCDVTGEPYRPKYMDNYDVVHALVGDPEQVDELWRMNDGIGLDGPVKRASFAEIADYIEANL